MMTIIGSENWAADLIDDRPVSGGKLLLMMNWYGVDDGVL